MSFSSLIFSSRRFSIAVFSASARATHLSSATRARRRGMRKLRACPFRTAMISPFFHTPTMFCVKITLVVICSTLIVAKFLRKVNESARMLSYMPSIQTYLRLLAYNPSDRAYDAAHTWLCGLTSAHELSGAQNESATREILEIATSTYENQEHIPSVKKLSELVKTNENDSIHIPELKKIIGEALAIMGKSRDPMHDQTHILRAIRFAHILYKKLLSENKTLDWGIIVAALSWHDVYRVKNLGFLYNKNTPLT